MSRVVFAFLIAPLAVPVLLVPYIRSMNPSPSLSVFALEISVAIAYGGAALLGIPVYLFFRAHHWTAFWFTPILGFAAGAIMWLAFSVMFVLTLGEGISGVQLALTDPNMLKGIFWPGGVLGAVVGMLFWLIARPDRQLS